MSYLYVGSFQRAKGIRTFSFDEESGEARLIGSGFTEIDSGSALADTERGIIYFTNQDVENPAFQFGGGGEVYALKVGDDGNLSLFDKTPSYGVHPAYSALSRDRRHMIVTHYTPPFSVATTVEREENGEITIKPVLSDSTTALFGIEEDGSFGRILDVVKHPMRPGRKENPHLHSVNLSPLWDIYAVCDMASDEIYMFKIEGDRLVTTGNTPFEVEIGAGPRYSAFHPTAPLLFVNCEHKPLLKVFLYDRKGTLEPVSSKKILPEGMEENPRYNPTGMALSRDGGFLYITVRGADIVSVFRIDAETGGACFHDSYALAGEGPRSCAISPDGNFLAVANKQSNTVEILKIGADGRLSPCSVVDSPSPGVVIFFGKDGENLE